MSNSTSSTSNMPQEVVCHVLSFNHPLDPTHARINHQFHDAHTDLLGQNIRQIFEQCSTDPTTLDLFINSLKERCRIAELRDDYSHFDGAGVNHLHQLIVQEIRSFGIPCPNTYLSPQEVHRYAAAVEDLNLQRAWDVIRQVVILAVPAGAPPLDPPAVDAPAAAIRAWMDVNLAALQQIRRLDLSNRQLTCIPREIALLTGLRKLNLGNNQIRGLPVEIFNELVGLQELSLHNNQMRELPVGIFNNLVGLQQLYLHNNQISELPVGIFNELVGLRGLYLHNNQIKELSVRIFNGLVRLQRLSLGNNQIKELPVRIFNGLVELQGLSLHNNQISELPAEIFNGLVGLQTLHIRGNPRLLVFYKELQLEDSNSCKNTFDAFHQYVCKSAFAQFYQFAAQGHSFGNVIDAFHNLDQTTKNAIYGMVYEEAGRPTTDDLQWGEHHAFDDKEIFNGALKRYVRGRFDALSESQKNAVYGRIRELAQEDQENVLRLIDAMMAAAPEVLLN